MLPLYGGQRVERKRGMESWCGHVKFDCSLEIACSGPGTTSFVPHLYPNRYHMWLDPIRARQTHWPNTGIQQVSFSHLPPRFDLP